MDYDQRSWIYVAGSFRKNILKLLQCSWKRTTIGVGTSEPWNKKVHNMKMGPSAISEVKGMNTTQKWNNWATFKSNCPVVLMHVQEFHWYSSQDGHSIESRMLTNRTHRHDLLLLWPWPDDLDIQTWPENSEVVATYQK